MNLPLKREIILHIFKTIGLFADETNTKIGFTESLVQDKFLIDKKIVFETDDQSKFENNIWSASAKVGESVIKIMIADIAQDTPEFAAIIQMNEYLPHALRLSDDKEDFGSISLNVKDATWIDVGTPIQAKLLAGTESLTEYFVEWKKTEDYSDIYKKMVMFLNFEEEK